MSGGKKSRAARNGRLGEGRLWDRDGREWQRVEGRLSREHAAKLLSDPAVPVVVQDDFGAPLQWLGSAEREAFWRNHVEPEFAKKPIFTATGHFSKTRYSRSRLFAASLWRSGSAELLLLSWD